MKKLFLIAACLAASPAIAADAPKPAPIPITTDDVTTIRQNGDRAGQLCNTSPQGVQACFFVVRAAELANRIENGLQKPQGK